MTEHMIIITLTTVLARNYRQALARVIELKLRADDLLVQRLRNVPHHAAPVTTATAAYAQAEVRVPCENGDVVIVDIRDPRELIFAWKDNKRLPMGTVMFCGTLAAKGVKLQTGDGQMLVLQQGAVKKLVQRVDQITFSGPQGLVRGQEVLYLTERASFRLTPLGIELFEIAPGIDLQRDVLEQMDFAPRVAQDLKVMDSAHFKA